MTEAFFVQTNRQNHHSIDFERLFEDVSVAATFADKTEYGEQLRPLNEGDRVLMYDQPSSSYLGVGTVSKPWNGEDVTNTARKVAPDEDVEEFHVDINWEHWRQPSNGYNRATVNRILEYDETYAPPQSVMPIKNPDEQAINRVYSIISDGGELPTMLTSVQRKVLNEWREVAEKHIAGEEFDFEKHDRTKDIQERADEFITDPTTERFKSMWDRMHAAIQRGNAENILSKWDSSIDELAGLIKTIRDADQYDDQWESELGGKTTVRELFGNLHIEEYPIINAATESGLAFFDYEQPDSYAEGVEEFEDFLETYEQIVGHATAEADHGLEIPIRLEVDQLFNVIDKVDESSIENESQDAAIQLYRTVLNATTHSGSKGGDESTVTLQELAGTDASPFWVNQGNQAEIRDEYLRAKVDNEWHHDLERVAEGDVVFHNFNDELIGYSIATGHHETYSFRDQKYQRIAVNFHWFDESISVDSGLKETLGQEKYRTEKYYPINSNDQLAQAYLADLSNAAANFLLSQVDLEIEQETPTDLPSKPDSAADIERQLIQNKQVILYGPPGTGKTFDAMRFAKRWVQERTNREAAAKQIRSVTFHPSFSYEDFIEGLTADATESGSVTYGVEDGVLKDIVEDANDALESTTAGEQPPPFVLIIDEINRGNLAQIFGELITLLEADKRGEFETDLAHSGHTFTIPPNLYVIGTMNTADQSIALVDTALRRRFRFLDFPPNLDIVFSEETTKTSNPHDAVTQRSDAISRREQLLGASVLAVEKLNERILDAADLGKGKQIGHAYLLGHDSAQQIEDEWRYTILPQLEEYYFGQFDRLRNELLKDTGDTLIVENEERIRDFNAHDLYATLCTIAGIDDPAPLAGPGQQSLPDGNNVPESEYDDAWSAEEKSPETFRERISSTLADGDEAEVERILDAGEELAWLDAGRGDKATAQVKSDAVDPGVGLIQITQDGIIEFRWNWLSSTDSNPLTADFIDDASTAFNDIDTYTHEYDPEENSFTDPEVPIQDLSEDDVTTLIDGLESFIEQAAQFEDD